MGELLRMRREEGGERRRVEKRDDRSGGENGETKREKER